MMPSRLLPIVALLSCIFAAAAQEPSRSLNPLAALGKATLKDFVEQPLFEPSRRQPVVSIPYVSVAPPAPAIEEPPPSLRLLGLVEGAKSFAAVVHRNDTGKTETLRPGDRIGSWTVQIMPAALRVTSGSRSYDYALFRGGSQQGPVAVEVSTPPFLMPALAAREPLAAQRR